MALKCALGNLGQFRSEEIYLLLSDSYVFLSQTFDYFKITVALFHI
jgi:hypothetical protein